MGVLGVFEYESDNLVDPRYRLINLVVYMPFVRTDVVVDRNAVLDGLRSSLFGAVHL